MINKVIEWLGVLACVAGMLLLSESYMLSGFIVNIVSQFLWGIFAYRTRAFGLLSLEILLTLISINGIFNS